MRKLLLILLLILSFDLFGQGFTPIVTQFTKKEYNASNQNWSVGQGKDGIMYFGNNQGLLQFDGSRWDIYNMPEKKMVRSLMVNRDNRIFVGSFEEFGYYVKDANGQLLYTSLSSRLQNYVMQNDEIWNILEDNGTIIFQSFTSYFTYKNGQVKGFRCPYTFLFFNNYHYKIYTHTDQYGFSYFDSKRQTFAPVSNNILKSPVVSVLPFDPIRALLITKSDGLFLWDGTNMTSFKTEADAELKKADINRAVISSDGVIVLGTILNGVTALTKKGQKLWTLNTSNVLQNNTVLGMYCDRDNNLWLALDKGITHIQLNSSLRYIHSFGPSIGSIYSITYDAPDLYIGTNQGLYKAEYNGQNKTIRNIQLESRIKGQVWIINRFDNQQICGNNEQTFDVSSKGAKVMSPVKGGMCIKKGIIHGKEVLVQGTYTQLCIYVKVNGQWKFSHRIENFLNPVRYLEIDYTGTIWASHLHRGLYAIRLSPNLKKVEQITTFKTLDKKHKYPINVFSINNRVVFTDHTAFYTYDDIEKKIIPFKELNDKLGYFSHAHRVCHFKSDLYWFMRDGEAALVQVRANDIKLLDVVHFALFLNQTVDDYQNVLPLSDTECLFTLENGLALYSTELLDKAPIDIRLQLKSILSFDSESKNTAFLPLHPGSLPKTTFSRNNILFTVYFPFFSNLNNTNYRYKLEGLDKVWSEPTESSLKEYKYLPHGKYTLMVEVMTKSGQKLSQTTYSFEVAPPFYWSTIAKILYLIVFMGLIYGGIIYIRYLFQVKKDKIRIEEEAVRNKEIEKREKQIIALRNEKLESELTLKSKELAGSTMTIINKKEMLAHIKEEVMEQKKALGSQYPNKYYDKLIHLLDENLSSEEDWAIFETNFDRIHENFFRNLHLKYPELTSNDLRLCAYLRLNLSSKDMAHLMNISLKGVEVGRYRIRKKIGLPSTKSLSEFMIEFK